MDVASRSSILASFKQKSAVVFGVSGKAGPHSRWIRFTLRSSYPTRSTSVVFRGDARSCSSLRRSYLVEFPLVAFKFPGLKSTTLPGRWPESCTAPIFISSVGSSSPLCKSSPHSNALLSTSQIPDFAGTDASVASVGIFTRSWLAWPRLQLWRRNGTSFLRREGCWS